MPLFTVAVVALIKVFVLGTDFVPVVFGVVVTVILLPFPDDTLAHEVEDDDGVLLFDVTDNDEDDEEDNELEEFTCEEEERELGG